jgi:ElaB/YqjD/DUF883 family membrane-anchored ribosome-binding protein
MNAEELNQKAADGLDTVVDQFGDAAEHVEGAMQKAKEQFMAWEKQGMECARDAAKQADQYVKEKPWQAVGIAAAVGLVAGLLINRR